MSLRIRQIVIAARELEATVERLGHVLDAPEVYRDPGVAAFGLENAMLLVGDQFLEVVSPTRDDTAAGRHIQRHGDSPYMLILQTDDLARDRDRIQRLGVRIIWEAQRPGVQAVHLHPKDVGGAILSLDEASPPAGWPWAGNEWRASAGAGRRVTSVAVGARDAVAMAGHWARLLGVEAPVAEGDTHRLELDGGALEFEPAVADVVTGFSIALPDPDAALDRARARGLEVVDGTVIVSGARFRLAESGHD